MSEIPPDWYDGFFESEWLGPFPLPEHQRTDRQVEFIVEELALAPGLRVLDLACGRGRISIGLAQRGCRVTGLDLSPRSLALAREDATAAGVEIELVRRDMRELDADGEFDGVVNVFTSFGYFPTQEEDERVVAAVARALVPGGRFLIDTLNTIAIAKEFREADWHELDDGTLWLERRRYDQLTGRHEATWTFVRPDGSRSELRHSLRGYTPAELVAMLRRAGLEVDGSWGSWDGTELGDGTRTILRARKPD
ncbi:MAG TPA: methyltransferase domain-containing protein [Gaiellaceae bacterium]